MSKATATADAGTLSLESLGIEFVDESQVPEPPARKERHDEVWAVIQAVFPQNPGQWGRVLTFNYATGAASQANKINKGENKKFPADKWEARYEVTEKATEADEENGVEASKGESVLYMRYTG
jgi:hypothetical protein